MRYQPLLNRLRQLEPEEEFIAFWPPIEGSLGWAIMEGRTAAGLATPDKPPGESGYMFLARVGGP